MIKFIVLSVLLSTSLRGESLSSKSYDTETEYSQLTEMDTKCILPEARRRGGKGDKKRRRGGNGLR
jgi:hypothetical protein